MRERRFMQVDKDNFNAVMEGLSPSLELQVESALPGQSGFMNVDLQFKSMADFTPENLAKQIEPLRHLLEVRGKLSDLKGRALSNEKLRDRLAEILAEHADKLPQANEEAETAAIENRADDVTPEDNNAQ